MRKALFLALFLCLIVTPLQSSITVTLMGGGSVANTCASGTYEAGYDGDHSSGADYICYESGTANEQASANTADSVSSSYVQFDAANEALTFTLSGDISADIDSQGSVFFSWRNVDNGDTTYDSGAILELTYSATENINCASVAASQRIFCFHLGAAESNNVFLGGLTYDTDYRCGYTWDATANTHALDCVASGSVAWTSNGGSPDDEDSEAIDGFDDSGAVDPTFIAIGENLSNSAFTGDDDHRVWDVFLTTGYKGTDPGTL